MFSFLIFISNFLFRRAMAGLFLSGLIIFIPLNHYIFKR